MRRSDRLIGILLTLRSSRTVSAGELAARFDVSVRTIYRDLDALSGLGVPLYAEPGRGGGYRLLEGYYLPAISFSQDEAVALAVGLGLLRSLPVRPFAASLDQAEGKLIAALPETLRATLAHAQRFIGFEGAAEDAFHPEPEPDGEPDAPAAVDTFVRARLTGQPVALTYRSPYSGVTRRFVATPLGLLWDRGHWYLIGSSDEAPGERRLWRADRVRGIELLPGSAERGAATGAFDIGSLLGRAWLRDAMADWVEEATVAIAINAEQAARLRRDWYFRWARFQPGDDGRVVMTYGEDNREQALALLRWLGPEAELLAPREWRDAAREQLRAMAERYREV